MCSFIFRLIFSLIAIALGVSGIALLTIRQRSLDSSIYKSSLNDSGIYKLAETEIQSQITNLLNKEPEDSTENAGSLIANRIIKLLFNNLKFSELLKKTTENNISNFADWLDNRVPELIIYFPRNDIVGSFKSEEFKQELLTAISEEIDKLPVCTSAELAQIDKAAEDTSIQIPNCKPDNSQDGKAKYLELFEAEYDKQFAQQGPVEKYLSEAGLGAANEQTPISVILSTQSAENQENTKTTLQNIKNAFSTVQLLGIIFVALAGFFTFLVLILGKFNFKRLLGSPATIWIIIGMLTLMLGVILKLAPDLIINQIPFNQLSPNAEFATVLKKLALGLSSQLFDFTIFAGIIVLIVSFIIKLISILIPSRDKKENPTYPSQPLVPQGKPLISEAVLGKDKMQTIVK